ncbi:MAG: fibronectin type III domain-containing protein [Brevundimonas sp.]
MTLLAQLNRRVRLAAAIGVVALLTVGFPIAQASQAQAATVAWVDGGDDQMCLQDDMGAALTSLAEDKFCQPIPTCHEYDGNNPKYKGRIVQSSASTGIWQGDPNDVLYEDNLPSDYNLSTTPTTAPTPTKSPTPVKTPKPTTGPTKAPTTPTTAPTKTPTTTPTKTPTGTKTTPPTSTSTPGTKTPTGTKTTGTTPTPAKTITPPKTANEDLGIDPNEKVAAGAPTAPGTPTLTVDGSSIVVTWEPSADVDLDSVTGYVVQLSGDNRAETDAATTSYTFTDLPDGSYRAAVRAVNEVGQSAASTPSDVVTVGTPIESVVGSLTWTGDVTPGATVTLVGSGYAANASLDIELHSDPVLLTTVTTDAAGAFSTDVVVPADAPEGAHNFVVAYQGTVISQSPVTVVAAPVVAAGTDEPAAAAAPVETVPPLTGVIILVALAVAGVLLLVSHYARGGSRRNRSVATAAPAPAAAALTPAAAAAAPAAVTATYPPLLSKPTIPAFLAGTSVASPARPASEALRAPEASTAR